MKIEYMRKIRLFLGLTITDAAESADVARSTIVRLEQGEYKQSEALKAYRQLLLNSLEYDSRRCGLAKVLLDHVKEQA